MVDKSLVLVRPHIPKAETRITDAREAVQDIARQLEGPVLAGVMFFCAASYDLEALGAEMKSTFSCPVFGCTTAGEIGLRYQQDGIVSVGLPAALFSVNVYPAGKLEKFQAYLDYIEVRLPAKHVPARSLGLLLFDGHSKHSVQAPYIHHRLRGIETVGAAAAHGDLDGRGLIYDSGVFLHDAALFALLETRLPFHCFDLQYDGATDYVNLLTKQMDSLREAMPDPLFTIAFEGRRRRRVIEDAGIHRDIEFLLSPFNLTGFTTFRELNHGALHSDTLTGVVFGA